MGGAKHCADDRGRRRASGVRRGLAAAEGTAKGMESAEYRLVEVSLRFLYEGGVGHFCRSASGNSSTGFAQGIGHIFDMQMELFTAEDFKDRVHYAPTPQIRHHVMRE